VSLSAIPRPLRIFVFERDCGCCQYCRLSQVGQAAIFHINHIMPRSRGGATEASNLALQCPCCSLHKADKVRGTDPESGGLVPLFHPLQQQWHDHFEFGRDGLCMGRTSTGRATVAALRMNDPLPRIARLIQRSLGLIG
jgi:hypothetical protein